MILPLLRFIFNVMKFPKQLFYLLFLTVIIYCGCKKEETTNHNYSYLLLPAGRSFLGMSEITVTIDSKKYNAEKFYDGYGGYWIKIRKDKLPSNCNIEIRYKRQKEDVLLFKEIYDASWLAESYYIDCSDAIKTKAAELTKGHQSNINKAKQIQQYVINETELRTYHNSFLTKASRTYEFRTGTCINFSRLFISLCRAANIPARSVWGIVYGYPDDKIYDYHHQWAEILDDDGYWHPLDFNYTHSFDLSDIRYLDLLYSAEENLLLFNDSSYEVVLGDVTYFNNYPASLTGRLGFELVEDKRPEYMVVKYVYKHRETK